MILRPHLEMWRLKKPFRISKAVYHTSDVLVVEVEHDGHIGRGEAGGVDYLGDTPETMLEQAAASIGRWPEPPSRESLIDDLPPGGFRNALDAALWDLEAKRSGRRVRELAGLPAPKPLRTFMTLGMDTPEAMAADAAALAAPALIKMKLGDEADIGRLEAVRSACPNATIIVDANEAWTFDGLRDLMPHLQAAGVSLIEQPLPAGSDDALSGYDSPIALCADESCQTRASLAALKGKYAFVNIKLDKTGGLTEALALARDAQAMGFRLMVGCMAATSLGNAPGFLIGQMCEVVDLDWQLLNQSDRASSLGDTTTLAPFSADLWG